MRWLALSLGPEPLIAALQPPPTSTSTPGAAGAAAKPVRKTRTTQSAQSTEAVAVTHACVRCLGLLNAAGVLWGPVVRGEEGQWANGNISGSRSGSGGSGSGSGEGCPQQLPSRGLLAEAMVCLGLVLSR